MLQYHIVYCDMKLSMHLNKKYGVLYNPELAMGRVTHGSGWVGSNKLRIIVGRVQFQRVSVCSGQALGESGRIPIM